MPIYACLLVETGHLFAVNAMQAKGTIQVWNNGFGIPVDIHKEENVYIPELIFGHLLTSSNYDDNEKKVRNRLMC